MSLPESLRPLRDVIARHGLGARKGLGQHFLLDLNLTRRITRAAGDLAGRTVIEIGAGPGGLTRSLLETDAARVVAIERDTRCIAALTELQLAYPGRLDVLEADALKVSLSEFGHDLAVVANLPYNIATPLLIGWLRTIDPIGSMTLMFQKEVANRIVAAPRTAAYGRLAVITQWLCEARHVFDVAPGAFVPPPKVTSSVIALAPRPRPLAPARFEMMERVTAAAFGKRRKMLRSALKGLILTPEHTLKEAGINPVARAETLSVESFCALARAVEAISPRS